MTESSQPFNRLLNFWKQNPFSDDKIQPPLLSKKSAQGEVIKYTFRDKANNLIAKERVIRINTVGLLNNGSSARLDYLRKELGKASNEEEKKKINQLIKEAETAIKINKNINGTWGSNNTPRFAFRFLGLEARKNYVPILCNLRVHKVFDAHKQQISTINRSGSITDFAHGEISLQELKDYRNLKKMSQGSFRVDPETLKRLTNLYQLDPDNPKKTEKLCRRIEDQIRESYGQDIGLMQLDEIIAQRENVLRELILQDLHTHFTNEPVAGQEVFYGRVGLLNAAKDAKREEGGLILNERTQTLDMKAIYDQLQGVQIHFDQEKGAGSFFDLEGQIHMPKDLAKDNIQKKTLNTLFFNISVQRNTKNKGIQKAINEEAFDKLKIWKGQNKLTDEAITDMTELEEIINNNSIKGFERADIAIKLMRHVGKTSVNCFGGKDRTGYALATVTYRLIDGLIPKVDQNDSAKKKERRKLMNKIALELVSKESVLSRVAEDTAGHRIIKLFDFDLPLYVPKTVKGASRRSLELLQFFQTKTKGKGQSPEIVTYSGPIQAA